MAESRIGPLHAISDCFLYKSSGGGRVIGLWGDSLHWTRKVHNSGWSTPLKTPGAWCWVWLVQVELRCLPSSQHCKRCITCICHMDKILRVNSIIFFWVIIKEHLFFGMTLLCCKIFPCLFRQFCNHTNGTFLSSSLSCCHCFWTYKLDLDIHMMLPHLCCPTHYHLQILECSLS